MKLEKKFDKNKIILLSVVFYLITVVFLTSSNLKEFYPYDTHENKFDTNPGQTLVPYIQDEIHTLVKGMDRITKVREFNEFWVGSSTRNLVISLSPAGIVYMNQKLGRNYSKITRYDYSSYSYIKKNANSMTDYIENPNLQNFRYFLLLMINLLILFFLLLLSIRVFYQSKNYFIFVLFIVLFLNNQGYKFSYKFIYTDLTNILIYLVFLNVLFIKNEHLVIKSSSLGLVSALFIGNNIGNLIILFSTIIYLLTSYKKNIVPYVLFILTFGISFILLNWYELHRLFIFADHQLSNFWNYATDETLIQPSGLSMIKNVAQDTVPWVFVIILTPFYKQIKNENLRKIFILNNFIGIIYFLGNFSNYKYVFRNNIIIFCSLIFSLCLFLKFIDDKFNLSKTPIIVSTLILLSSLNLFNTFKNNEIDYEIRLEEFNCENSLVINLEKEILPTTYSYQIRNFKITEPVLGLELQNKWLSIINNTNPDCIIVKETRDSKFLTNEWVLENYKLANRKQKIMFFIKDA